MLQMPGMIRRMSRPVTRSVLPATSQAEAASFLGRDPGRDETFGRETEGLREHIIIETVDAR